MAAYSKSMWKDSPERHIHWSGLAWHKRNVRARYRREAAAWWKQYCSGKAQAVRHLEARLRGNSLSVQRLRRKARKEIAEARAK